MAEAVPDKTKATDSLLSALQLMQEALPYLDDGRAPADVGAYLDHAIVNLERFLAELMA